MLGVKGDVAHKGRVEERHYILEDLGCNALKSRSSFGTFLKDLLPPYSEQ